MLREVASKGPWVSAHPDVILKMGVKEVLHRTRHLAGAPTRAFTARRPSFAPTFRPRSPQAVHASSSKIAATLVKGIWKVERTASASVVVLEAQRGSVPEE